MTPADALERGDAPPSDYERAVEAMACAAWEEAHEGAHLESWSDRVRRAPSSAAEFRAGQAAALAALCAAGFAVVPREPTEKMTEVADKSAAIGYREGWSAMLAAGEVKSP